MALIFSYSPSFESEDFKANLKNKLTFKDEIEIEARKKKYDLIDGKRDKPQGKLVDDESRSEYDQNDPMHSEMSRWRISVEACIRNYTIRAGLQIGSQIQIVIPRVVDFEIEIFTRLLLSKNLNGDNEAWLQKLYDDFQGDENDLYGYIALHNSERERRGISMDDFDIISYGIVKKLDDREILDQYDWYSNLVSQSESELVLESKICQSDVPTPQVDPLREGEDPNVVHQNLRFTPEKKSCEVGFEMKPEKITTLIAYPEFKIIWVRKVIKIGCSRISIKWPKLMTRLRKKVLYFSAFHVDDFGRYIRAVIKVCLKQSATYGLVVALAAQNINAGLAVFRALFEKCIYAKIGQTLECFFPELFIQTEKTRWKPL